MTFKDPDVIFEAISEAVNERIKAIKELDDEERDVLIEKKNRAVSDQLSKWIEYGDFITVEFDTDLNTARIVPKGE